MATHNELCVETGWKIMVAVSAEDPQTGTIDALTDLMHFCRAEGVDFDACLSMATDHFSEELVDNA